MTPVYLSATTARDRLIAKGLYTAETVPSIDELEELLTAIEVRVDEWLGHRIAVTEYKERYTTNSSGDVFLRHYPVVAVIEVGWYREVVPGFEPTPVEPLKIQSTWQQNRRLNIPLTETPVLITYLAGYDPVPPIFAIAMWDLLFRVLNQGLNSGLSFLDEPVRDMTSLSLPGGVSKSFQLGKASDSGLSSGKVIDRALAPLIRYRRRIIC